jgi:hypothetical protein
MYIFNRESKCIITPDGRSIKGKAVTEELNNYYYRIFNVVKAMELLEYAMWSVEEEQDERTGELGTESITGGTAGDTEGTG